MVTLSGKPQLFTGWLSPENLVTQWALRKVTFPTVRGVYEIYFTEYVNAGCCRCTARFRCTMSVRSLWNGKRSRIVFLMSSVQMDQGEQLRNSLVLRPQVTPSLKDGKLQGNKKLKVNTDSTRKGPGNTTIRPTDELAPNEATKSYPARTGKNPDSQLVVAFNERPA